MSKPHTVGAEFVFIISGCSLTRASYYNVMKNSGYSHLAYSHFVYYHSAY